MPLHDWTRVDADVWHAFHLGWITKLSAALNRVLTPDHYALVERVASGDEGRAEPDVITLAAGPAASGGVALAEPVAETSADPFAPRKNVVAVRYTGGDRVVAVVEFVSPGNKSGGAAFEQFLEKATGFLDSGVHLLIVDPFPPTPRDPDGVHAALWSRLDNAPYRLPPGRRSVVAAYEVRGRGVRAYVNTLALGEPIPDAPVFLRPGAWVAAPLEATYTDLWERFPRRWRDVVAPPG